MTYRACRVCHEREETHVVMREKTTGPILWNVWTCTECLPRVVEKCAADGETVRVFGIAPDPNARPKLTLEQLRAHERTQRRRRDTAVTAHLAQMEMEA